MADGQVDIALESVTNCQDENTYRATFDAGQTSPSVAVAAAIASVRGVPPNALEEPLYDSVDPDALNRIVGGQSDDVVSVTFSFAGHSVIVSSGGVVRVSQAESTSDTAEHDRGSAAT